QGRAEQDHRETGPADRENREAEEGRQERYAAERPGQDDARVEDLVADPAEACEEEQRQDVRVDQRVQEAREEAGMHLGDERAGGVEDEAPARPLRLAAVDRAEELREARR